MSGELYILQHILFDGKIFPGADLGLIWQRSPFLGARKLMPKKNFPVKNKPVSVTKRPLFTSELAFYSFVEVFRATKWSEMFVRLI